VRVALIGAAARASGLHYPTLSKVSGVEIVAVADSDGSLAKETAARYGTNAHYRRAEELLQQEAPDAAYVIQLPQLAFEAAATVIASDCHLILKEPPGITSEQTRQLALLAERQGVLTGVPFHRRFSPVIRQGKSRCEQDGAIHSAVATFYKNAVGGPPYYGGAAEIIRCDAIHAVDTLRYLCGGVVESVASDVRRLGVEHRNAHTALVRFRTGAVGVLLSNWVAGKRLFSVEAHGSGVSFFGDPEQGGTVYAGGRIEPDQKILVEEPQTDGSPPSFGLLDVNRHLVECFRSGLEPETGFRDALKTMELVDAILESQI